MISLRLKCWERKGEEDQLKNCESEVMACDYHKKLKWKTVMTCEYHTKDQQNFAKTVGNTEW